MSDPSITPSPDAPIQPDPPSWRLYHEDPTDPGRPLLGPMPPLGERWGLRAAVGAQPDVAEGALLALLAERGDLDDQLRELTAEVLRVQDERDELAAVLREIRNLDVVIVHDQNCAGCLSDESCDLGDWLNRVDRVLDQTREEPGHG